MSKFNSKGTRRFKCADCGATCMLHPMAATRRCKPRCNGCGGTFLEPDTDGAVDAFVNIGTAKAVLEKCVATDKDAPAMMRGDRDVPGYREGNRK